MPTCSAFSTLPCMHQYSIFEHSHHPLDNLIVITIFAARSESTKKVVKYIGSLMLEGREMREGSGFIYLKVLQLSYFVPLLASKNHHCFHSPVMATYMHLADENLNQVIRIYVQ